VTSRLEKNGIWPKGKKEKEKDRVTRKKKIPGNDTNRNENEEISKREGKEPLQSY
jgi:hypothetical protein